MSVIKKAGKRGSILHTIRDYKFRSVFIRNLLLVTCMCMIPISFTVSWNFNNFRSEVNNLIETQNFQLLQNNAVIIDNILADAFAVLANLAEMPGIRYSMGLGQAEAGIILNDTEIGSAIGQYLLTYAYFENIIMHSRGYGWVYDGQYADMTPLTGENDKWYDIYQGFSMASPYTLPYGPGYIMLCEQLFADDGEPIGIVVIIIGIKPLFDILDKDNLPSEQNFFFLETTGNILFCNNEGELLQKAGAKQEYESLIRGVGKDGSKLLEHNGDKAVSVYESVYAGWKYALICDMSVYVNEINQIRRFLAASVTFAFLPMFVSIYIITSITYRPIKKLLAVVDKPEDKFKKDTNGRFTKSDELIYITGNILSNIQTRIELAEELEKRINLLKRSQVQALQFQMDPHFLYNTLEMIKWKAAEDMGIGSETEKMLTKMARLYRIGFDSERLVVPLREEIEFAGLYIDLLNERFNGRTAYTWDIDDSLLDCMVLKLCLQPVLENAIKHGLKQKRYYGKVHFAGYVRNGALVLSVKNDGITMTQKQIDVLNAALRGDIEPDHISERVGLRNISIRIRLIFGMDYGVSVYKEDGSEDGLTVEMTFPNL